MRERVVADQAISGKRKQLIEIWRKEKQIVRPQKDFKMHFKLLKGSSYRFVLQFKRVALRWPIIPGCYSFWSWTLLVDEQSCGGGFIRRISSWQLSAQLVGFPMATLSTACWFPIFFSPKTNDFFGDLVRETWGT